jgi:predicted Zn-dependent protease
MLSRIAILLTFSWLYTLANAQPAAVSVKQLLMSDELLSARMVIAGDEKELRYFINNLETTDHRLPEEWQQKAIRESTYRASSILNVSVIETQERELADVIIYVAKKDQQDYLSGSIGESVMEISVSHNSGRAAADGKWVGEQNDLAKSTWRNIFLHELGHFLGLEHPWDKDDGDWAVSNWSDPHASTRMGYNEHLDGGFSWFSDLDIEALEYIWGKGLWQSYFSGVPASEDYDIDTNNIGVFEPNESAIFSCLKLTTDGLPTTLNGISEFDVRFDVLSLEEGTVQVGANRAFNIIDAKTSPLFIETENAATPDCSGTFENATGVYTDLVKSGSSVLNTSWRLIDAENLILKINSYEQLQPK